MSTPAPPASEPSAQASASKGIRAFASLAFTAVRKAPVLVVAVLVVAVLYYRNPQNLHDTGNPEPVKPIATAEPKPPPELPPGKQSLWLCVQRMDDEMTGGRWSDVYYGMEAKLDGTSITVKVTEEWKKLSETKRQTVAQLVVDTWIKNGQALKLLQTAEDSQDLLIGASGDKFQEIVIQGLPDDQTVAAWKPATGLQIFETQIGVSGV